MFRVAISSMTGSERMKKYPINFKAKGYPNKDHAGVGEAAKRLDPKTGVWHYLVICQTFQLHGEEGEREGLRRTLPGVPTIKANEVLGDICVVQPEPRGKPTAKPKKTAEEPARPATPTKPKKTTEEPAPPATPTEETHRGKRRQSEDEPTIQTKRPKRGELAGKDGKPVIHVSDDSDVEPRKTRAQTRKEILKELEDAIAAGEQETEELGNEPQTPKKPFTMSGGLTARSPKEQTPKSTSSAKPTPVSGKRLTVFKDPEPQPPAQDEHDVLITSFNALAAEFFTMNEAVIELRETRDIGAFLATWNKVATETNDIFTNIGYY
jgi:hypothetical protein